MHKNHLLKIVLFALVATLALVVAGCAPQTINSNTDASTSSSASSSASSAASSAAASSSAASSSAASSAASSSSSSSQSSSSSSSNSSSSSSSSSSSASDELTEVSFLVDGNYNVAHTGLMVAIYNGYFEEEGIEVQLVSAPAYGSDPIIGTGGANLGITTQDRIANNLGSASPLPYTAVAAVVQHNTSGIMARSEDEITSPSKLVDKRYATRQMPVEQAMVRRLITNDGGNADALTMVTLSNIDEVSGLQTDVFDSVMVYDWWSVSEANLIDYPVSFMPLRNVSAALDFYTPVIAVNDQFAADNKDTVKSFLKALKRGYEYATENPTTAADILLETVSGLDPDLVYRAQAYLSTEYIDDATSWGLISEPRWSAYNQWLMDNGLVDYTFDPASGYTMDYLE